MAVEFEMRRCVTVLIIAGALMVLLMGGPGYMPKLLGGIASGESLDIPGVAGAVDTPAIATFPAFARVAIGFHESISGTSPLRTPEHWYNIGKDAAGKFNGTSIGAIWVIGFAQADGQCYLNFPSSVKYPGMAFSKTDENEGYLDYFDGKGMSVILQVEPGQADVDRVIRLVLDRYAHHPCVVGFGIDVEWLQFRDYPEGRPVTDVEAARWYNLVSSYDRGYKLALTHWGVDKMPPTYRAGLYFLYDGHGFSSLDDMIARFESWGNSFPDNPVGFYIGFPTDEVWWGRYDDPLYTIGDALLKKIRNTRGIYWFDGGHLR